MPKPNPLNVYASYNNIFTFGCLSKGEINGGARKPPTNVILKSGGTAGENKVTTLNEAAAGINAEYFIDNVSMDSIIIPTEGTRTSNATNLSFEVIEPYSMGEFLQACKLAATELGYTNYLDAGFMFMIEFVGWDDNGRFIDSGQNARYIPVKLVNITFNVDHRGSVYQVECIPWNEQALADQTEQVMTDISITGKDVETVLEKGEESLATILNARFEELKQENKVKEGNKYKFEFPQDIPNEIPTSFIISGFNEGGNAPMQDTQDVLQDGVIAQEEAIIHNENRRFEFPASTKISRIIEEVVIASDYGKELKDRAPDGNGMVPWFRIETQVKFLESSAQEGVYNEDAKEYIFRIIPYLVHHTILAKPNDAGKGYGSLKGQAVKEYNYIYTGENSDIIDFEIQINSGFFTMVNSDHSQGNLDDAGAQAVERTALEIQERFRPSEASPQNSENGGGIMRNSNTTAVMGGGGLGIDNDKLRVAAEFHTNVLQGGVDLVILDLTIHGDPYFIADSGMGNYTAGIASLNETSDGTVNYQTSEVDILLTFKTIIDYNENGNVTFSVVPAYSGLYKVTMLSNNWQGNKFSQTLKLIRRRLQDEQQISGGGEDNSVTTAIPQEETQANYRLDTVNP